MAKTAYAQLADSPFRRIVDVIAAKALTTDNPPGYARREGRQARALIDEQVRDLPGTQAGATISRLLAEAPLKTAETVLGSLRDLGALVEEAIVERAALFARTGGASWDLHPVQKTWDALALLLVGVPEDDQERAMDAFLNGIVDDLTDRGFSEEEATAWCGEIAVAVGVREAEIKHASGCQPGWC